MTDNETKTAATETAQPEAVTPENRFTKISEEKRKAAATRRRRKKIIKWSIISAVLIIIAAASAFGIWKLFFEPEPPVPDQTAFSYRGPFSSSISGYGSVKATRTESVTAPAKGELLELYVTEGDIVYEGQPLFMMDDSVLRDQIATAEKQLDSLREQRSGYISSRTKAYENRSKTYSGITDFEKTLAEISGKLASRNLKAPFNGKILDLKVKEGDTVNEGQTIATIARDEEMTIKQYYSYAYENEVYVGQNARVSIPSTMEVLTGTVTSIDKVRRVSEEGGVLFAATITVTNRGGLTVGTEAMAVLKAKSGSEITPAEAGKFEYSQTETLTAPAKGKILTLNMVEYQEYRSGATLYTLSADGYEDQQDSANRQIDSIKDQIESIDEQITGLDKQIETLDENIVSKQEDIDDLYSRLPDFQGVAPMSGMVMAITASIGQTVDENGSIMAISDTTAMTLDMNLDERDVGKISVGTYVSLTQDTSEGSMFYSGIVTSISLEGKYEWGYAYFPATVTIQGGEGLRSGSSMRYEIILSSKEDCLLVPIAAVKYTDQGPCVFIKLAEGEQPPENLPDLGEGVVPEGYYAAMVETGLSDTTQIEIISGVWDGAELYLQPGVPGQVDSYASSSSARSYRIG